MVMAAITMKVAVKVVMAAIVEADTKAEAELKTNILTVFRRGCRMLRRAIWGRGRSNEFRKYFG